MWKNLKLVWNYSKHFQKKIIQSFLLLIVITLVGLVPAFLIQKVFDEGLMKGDYGVVLFYSIALASIYLIRSILSYASTYLFTHMNQNIIYKIREEISIKLLKYPLDFYNYKESGYITSRLNEVNNLSGLFSANTFKMVLGFFEFVGVLVILMIQNVPLTLIMCLLIPCYYLVSIRLMGSVSKYSKDIAEQSAQLNSKIQQSVSGIEEVKNLSLEDVESKKINEMTQKLMKASVKQTLSYSLGMEMIIFLGSVSTVILMVAGGKFIITQHLSIGVYMLFLSYVPKLYTPIQSISTATLTLQPAFISLQRLKMFLEEALEDADDSNKIELTEINTINVDHVGFQYRNAPLLFQNLSLELELYDKLMIFGENGSGKTTFFRLLMGLYECTEGNITLNGMEISSISKKSLRKNIGIVSQKIFLFNDTIEHNVKYGVDEVNEARYEEVIRLTELNKVIAKLGNQNIGENGNLLSGGEIQRVAIARALLRESCVFLFDEIAAHLDDETKRLMNKLLETALNDRICIFIDHSHSFDILCNKSLWLNASKSYQ
ncbi:ABC transporter ATP-binding protein [Paenibacillus sp. 19GGS1-52]|uniref:ABC transporter ATP-binding protein n=1 Tax=Paenibacillus sp. 19GGS1-52 TaxID=2758563 RepID=UPI001EFC16ED|nr:ABC transporter ATP-binding protein [Paenibacillus sp. 19GGS1-52]ULO09570.1 ABC transporter ATP-binding protein [Paenibacillus sp. 19GGS1-52]